MLLSFVIILLTPIVHAQGQCYYPGGSRAQDQSYCNLHVPTTSCCPIGWTCDTNLLCVLDDPTYANSTYEVGASLRGTCTNPEWDETYCGSFCLDNPVDDNSGSVIACGDGVYCCAPAFMGGSCDCVSGGGTFRLSPGAPKAVVELSQTVYPTYGFSTDQPRSTVVSLPSTTSVATSTTSSVAIMTPYLSIMSETRSTAGTALTSSAAMSLSTLGSSTSTRSSGSSTNTASPTSLSPQPVTDKTWFKAVIGILSGLAALLIVFIIWRYLLPCIQKRRKDKDSELETQPPKLPNIIPVPPVNTAPHTQFYEHTDASHPYLQSPRSVDPSNQNQGTGGSPLHYDRESRSAPLQNDADQHGYDDYDGSGAGASAGAAAIQSDSSRMRRNTTRRKPLPRPSWNSPDVVPSPYAQEPERRRSFDGSTRYEPSTSYAGLNAYATYPHQPERTSNYGYMSSSPSAPVLGRNGRNRPMPNYRGRGGQVSEWGIREEGRGPYY